MATFRRIVMIALPLALVTLTQSFAQPETAPPGTVCVTPRFWCYAVKPGPPGAPCACQTAQGWVAGTLR